tara:strand:- start:50 stop:1450 length:1401 start_codon:yes stop_codon:yes gene_type:complete
MSAYPTNRRHFLQTAGGGFGMLALRSLLAADNRNPMNVLSPEFAPRAKSVIFLFMYGGPSQVDTFDPKPALDRWNGKAIPTFRKEDAFNAATKATAMRSPYTFAKHGQSGLDICEKFPHLARHADELCVIRSLHADSNNHGPALFQMNSGFVQSGHPSMGSWVTYGLGSENENLPGYVVLTDRNGAPVNGAMNWSNGFMPATYQGVPFQTAGSPILYLKRPEGVTVAQQRRRLDLIRKWNERYSAANPAESALAARVAAYELAWRMQSQAPAAVDISRETKATRAKYGLNHKTTEFFGRNCLLARRLVERGVRFVQVYSGGNQGPTAWDAHGNLKENHDRQCAQTDQPIAALLTDLKQRGLLDTTLVVWGGEFGRLPTHQGSDGRDHNSFGFTMWLAGGGVRGGLAYGATDEFGYAAVENKVHVHDLHATILHLLGINHEQLTYRHLGRNFRLTDVEGRVVKQILS